MHDQLRGFRYIHQILRTRFVGDFGSYENTSTPDVLDEPNCYKSIDNINDLNL